MAKASLFSKIRARVTAAGKTVKFASVKFGADLSNFVPAPEALLAKLGIKGAYVAAGKRPSVRSIIVTPRMVSKARLEREEGRELKPAEVKQARGAKQRLAEYFKQKLRMDPRLDDSSLHPNFEENWLRDHRRFLRLVTERTGARYDLTRVGEWVETVVPGAERKVMSEEDWRFYVRHYHANEGLYEGIGPQLLELPPGAISPRTIRRGRSSGHNQTGRSRASYRAQRRAA